MKILLGKLKSNAGTYADGQNLYLEKHKWDCGWYWGFGYIGNKDCHFHFESLLYNLNGVQFPLASDMFESTKFTDNEWWIVRDLFIQAYALKSAAEAYRYGGAQSYKQGVTDVIKSSDMCTRINTTLELLLNTLWKFIEDITK
jgi:hypothetical protein